MANTKLRIQLYAHGSEKAIFERFIDYDENFRFSQVREALLSLYPGFNATVVFSIEIIS